MYDRKRIPKAVQDACHRCSLPIPDGHLLIAFSGGADSCALLSMMAVFCGETGMRLSAVHIEHGIRGEEALRDAAFCERFCKERGIPFSVYHCNVPLLAAESGRSLEEEARAERYRLISLHIENTPTVTHLLTAHHADDQSETVLFRMVRGTSPAGLRGISEIRPYPVKGRAVLLFRPMLGLQKADILAYCEENRLSYVTDSTNLEADCSRNRLRLTVLPALKEINPSFSDALLQLSEMAAEDERYFAAETDRILAALPGGTVLPTEALRILPLSILRRILYRLWERAFSVLRPQEALSDHMLTYTHIAAMTAALQSVSDTKTVYLPSDILFTVFPPENRLLFLSANKDTHKQPDIPKEIPVQRDVPLSWSAGHMLLVTDRDNPSVTDFKKIYNLSISTFIDSDKIIGSLWIRARSFDNRTDRYLCGGSMKTVKDALSAHKVPAVLRDTMPLICDKDGILWVPFCGIRDSVNPHRSEHPHLLMLYDFIDEQKENSLYAKRYGTNSH